MDNRFLCRGKRLDNGQWVYGSCVYNGELIFADRAFICPSVTAASSLSFDNKTKLDGFVLGEFCEVGPSTVGRCTGLSAAKSYRGTDPGDLLVFEGDRVRTNVQEDVIVWDSAFMQWRIKNTGPLPECDYLEIIGTVYDAEPSEC